MRHRLFVIALLGIIGFGLGPAVCPAQAQPRFVAIDMFADDLGWWATHVEAPQVLGESPLILVVEDVGAWYVRAMTVDATTGARLGRAVDVAFPPSPCLPPNPCAILYSEHFLPGQVIVLGDDMALVAFPISRLPDGTPDPGASVCHPPDPGAPDLGLACAMTEMSGADFGDGMARLFVGTQSGMIARFIIPVGGGPTLEGVIDLLAGQPIADLEPIPQTGGVVLGAAVGTGIVGIQDPGISPILQFTIIDPGIRPIRDFVVKPPNPNAPVDIAFCDGVNLKVPSAKLPADASGSSMMMLRQTNASIPILMSPPVGLALGSLLMLTEDGQGVYYDPGFAVDLGTSGCIANVNDPMPASCWECPVTLTGDVNQTNTLTSADIIFLVGFIFKSGAPPQPCQAAGDVNCDSKLTSADIIYLVNHVFKGGLTPCDVCSIIWTCP